MSTGKRKDRPTRVADEISPILRNLVKGKRGLHPEIWARWSGIVGPDLARRAVPRHLANRVLTVAVASSAWLHELSFLTAALVERFAEQVGPDVVGEIRFVLDPSLAAPPRLDRAAGTGIPD